MDIKKELQDLGIEIKDLLPVGAIKYLATHLQKERRSIPKMLKGLFGKKENLLSLLVLVDHIIEQDINISLDSLKEKRKAQKEIKKIINKHSTTELNEYG